MFVKQNKMNKKYVKDIQIGTLKKPLLICYSNLSL